MLVVSLHIKLIFDDFQEYFKLIFCNTFVCEYIVYIMTFSCVCILELVCPKHFFILSWQMKPWSLKTNSMHDPGILLFVSTIIIQALSFRGWGGHHPEDIIPPFRCQPTPPCLSPPS